MASEVPKKTETPRKLPTSIKIALLGPPGSGKGSQCVRIKERYPDLCYINPHMMVREEIHRGTPFGLETQKKLLAGEVIPHETYNGLFLDRAESAACKQGYILDGMPADVKQAEDIVKRGQEFDAVVFLEMNDDLVIRRTAGRWVHQRSGRIYHDTFARPKSNGVDDETGEKLVQRADDTQLVATQRLERYKAAAVELQEYWATTAADHKKRLKETIDAVSSKAAPTSSPADAAKQLASDAADASTPHPEEPSLTYMPSHYAKRLPQLKTVNAEGGLETVRTRVFKALDEIIREKQERSSRGSWWKLW